MVVGWVDPTIPSIRVSSIFLGQYPLLFSMSMTVWFGDVPAFHDRSGGWLHPNGWLYTYIYIQKTLIPITIILT